ncbi:Tfp pilus assembly protein PilN [Methylobacterium brachythecii]|uniref:Tfp pilus assembly protein PilN n=1 Tax=Methylobacterium brachythecii TaxID=1176177 RepID=A0A7W6AHU0_9HYPH|nr:Tfp pilus assembly protein PilN [Methylobacterium brachythecii]
MRERFEDLRFIVMIGLVTLLGTCVTALVG